MNATLTATSGTELQSSKSQTSVSTSKAPSLRAGTELELTSAAAKGETNSLATSVANPRRRYAHLLTGLATFGICAGIGSVWWHNARMWVKTDNAYVMAHIHTVSSRVAGTVNEVFVEENQSVAAGSILASLDPGDLEVKREQVLAQLAQARAQQLQAEAQIAQAQAQVVHEQARATKATQDLKRAESLYQGVAGAISKQEFDQAKAEADATEANVKAAESALGSANALAAAARAQEEVAQANLREADLQLSYTKILAPTSGRIGKRNVETGNRIQPGQALLAVVQPDVWITANFKETQLAKMKPRQLVRVRLDAFPSRVFSGRVESLSPASGAQFALLPPDNATGNFTKIVQRVPVKIVLTDESLAGCEGRIVSGMSAVVEVKVPE